MPDSLPAVLGFGVIFLIVGALGGAQLGLMASIIFLSASAVLLAFAGVTVLIALRRRATTLGRARATSPTAFRR
jgi:hypothetical protein